MDYENRIKIFKALSDKTRLEIMEMLTKEMMCACVIQEKLDLSQSGLSYHMKKLTDSGLVIAMPEGKWIHYKVNMDVAEEVINVMEEMLMKKGHQ